MGKYDYPDVVYRGYLLPIDEYTEMMNQIERYKSVATESYNDDQRIMCYAHWKHLCLKPEYRKRAPKVMEYRTSGVFEDPVTHMMFLTAYVPGETPEKVANKDWLLESEKDRRSIAKMVQFFRSCGVRGYTVDHFQFKFAVGWNHRYITT